MIASLAVLSSCAPSLKFTPQPGNQLYTRSSHLFVGFAVGSVYPFFPFFSVPGEKPNEWRIVRHQLSIETVLIGAEKRPLVYVYEIVPAGGRSGDWNYIVKGQRYLFPVRVEDGVYHLSGDHWRSVSAIHSGRHDRLPLDGSQPIHERLSLLCFWIAPDHSSSFPRAFSHLNSFSLWRTFKILRGFLRHPEERVRLRACMELVTVGLAQDECQPMLQPGAFKDESLTPENEILQNNRDFERRAQNEWRQRKRRALSDPDSRDDLRIHTTIRDPALRTHFCGEFVRLFPADTDHGCPADRPPPATIVTEAGDIPLTGPWPTR